MTKEKVAAWFDANRASVLKDYFELLRFPTIGADPAHLADCRGCADWIVNFLAKLGFTAEVVTGNPALPPVTIAVLFSRLNMFIVLPQRRHRHVIHVVEGLVLARHAPDEGVPSGAHA